MDNELIYAKIILPYMMTAGCWLAFGKFVAGLVFILWSLVYLFVITSTLIRDKKELIAEEERAKLAQSSHVK